MHNPKFLIWLIVVGVIFTSLPGYALQRLDKCNWE